MQRDSSTFSNSPWGPIIIAGTVALTILLGFLASQSDRNLFQATIVPPSSTPFLIAVASSNNGTTASIQAAPAAAAVDVEESPAASDQEDTPLYSPLTCSPKPNSWQPYRVNEGDSISKLGILSGATMSEIKQVNCLSHSGIVVSMTLYLPQQEPTRIPCGPPSGWTPYWVQSGDTMYALALRAGTTVYQIMQANCFINSNLYAGRSIWLPPMILPPPTVLPPTLPPATFTAEPTEISTATVTATATQVLPTLTSTPELPTVTQTAVPTITVTSVTPEPTLSPTIVSSPTVVPTQPTETSTVQPPTETPVVTPVMTPTTVVDPTNIPDSQPTEVPPPTAVPTALPVDPTATP